MSVRGYAYRHMLSTSSIDLEMCSSLAAHGIVYMDPCGDPIPSIWAQVKCSYCGGHQPDAYNCKNCGAPLHRREVRAL